LNWQDPKFQLARRARDIDPDATRPESTRQGIRSGPLYFGRSERPFFGWLHASEEPRGVGLLVCNPFGNEAVCAHRTIRHLCEEASRLGIPALRFDYDGTGDSAGDDDDPHRVEAWIESILLAADELKLAAGVDSLCFLGIRLGAILAATAATRRDDVIAFIAAAPVVSGKAYVREMRLLQRAIDAKRDIVRESTDDTLEAAGFVVSATTQTSLASLDLAKLERSPAPHVLALDRAELPGDSRWIQVLRSKGAEVDSASVTGYTEMMLDSHESVVPRDMIKTAVGWLSHLLHQGVAKKSDPKRSAAVNINAILEGATPRAVRPVLGSGETDAPEHDIAVREQAVRFGNSGTLFGILSALQTPPETPLPGAGKAILLLSSGATHHIGPNRLYVTIARHLAGLGYTVLRMDIAGIGDSPPRRDEPENLVYTLRANRDVIAGIEYLRSIWNIESVHAAGLCSGAYHAFKAAVARLRLNGVVLINPLTFFWKEGMSLAFPEYRVAADIKRYRRNIFQPQSWLKMLRGDVNLSELSHVLGRRLWGIARTPLRAVARTLRIPIPEDLPTELNNVVRAGIRMQFVFADHDPGHELLNTLGGRAFRRLHARGLIGVQTIEGADHTFTDRSRRVLLVAALERALSGSP
jgi:alpha-beta hydrolase superfamily lysophospholipase